MQNVLLVQRSPVPLKTAPAQYTVLDDYVVRDSISVEILLVRSSGDNSG